jgi:Arc/MetJ family transcription regulator
MVYRTTVELDQAQLSQVRAVLGTTGTKDTIEAAFERILRQARREALFRQVVENDGLDLDEATFAASRPRKP